ncbi:hypothetical protein NDU88_004158 [Pleurodeles waltl]|uniref:Uncharacterized protein n=1 Tax=Pleurodeles waltl TaxID=8319 RepID=A0AAV7W467_PLEWA|nr:hypothetical protein NDU88_004158 [Pleurodeles waltl]
MERSDIGSVWRAAHHPLEGALIGEHPEAAGGGSGGAFTGLALKWFMKSCVIEAVGPAVSSACCGVAFGSMMAPSGLVHSEATPGPHSSAARAQAGPSMAHICVAPRHVYFVVQGHRKPQPNARPNLSKPQDGLSQAKALQTADRRVEQRQTK